VNLIVDIEIDEILAAKIRSVSNARQAPPSGRKIE
jgi:hypothetical protein